MFNFDPEKGIPDFEKEQEKFIKETVEACLSELTDEDKKALLDNPDPLDHHFGYGMYIRNTFIHDKDLKFPVDSADYLSAEIVELIIRKLQADEARWHVN